MREKTNDQGWLLTPGGQPRGYIESVALAELWFHTGTNCNLSCPFCLEGSKPGDNRIQFITLEDAKPFVDEALELGVEKFSFTGGEPFVNPHFMDILDCALEHRPCFVLTNGTEPLLNRMASYTTAAQRGEYMCSYSRMIVKKNGRCGVYACTLVDDDEQFDLGDTLRESLDVRIRLKHHRCYSCFACGSTCSERTWASLAQECITPESE